MTSVIAVVVTATVSHSHTSSDMFDFYGNHAATSVSGRFTTVWLDEDLWDTRVSHSNTHNKGMGHHIDIHSAATRKGVDGALANDINVLGGVRGHAGVMVMHMNFQGIVSARLRNPLVLPMSATDPPARIAFYAPLVVTTGHWWEIALTRDIVGAEHTAVPSVRNNLPAASRDVGGITAGPGIDIPVPSYNIIFAGASDLMCAYPYARVAVSTSTQKISAPARTRDDLIPFKNLHKTTTYSDVLMRVVIAITHKDLEITLDYDDDGTTDYITTFAVTPQQQLNTNIAYVHLVGVAYQADHHPQLQQCNLGTERQLKWRDFSATPTRYTRTTSTDKGLVNQDTTGWRSYDMRDTMRSGGNNANTQRIGPQKNVLTTRGYCMRSVMWPCDKPAKSPLLYFSIPDDAAAGHIIYDIRTRVTDVYPRDYDFYFLIDGVHVFRPQLAQRLDSQWFDEYLHTAIALTSDDLDAIVAYHDAQALAIDDMHTLQLVITRGVVEIDRISVDLMFLDDDDAAAID